MERLIIILRRPFPPDGTIVERLEQLGATDINVLAALGLVTCQADVSQVAAISQLSIVGHERPDRAVGTAD